MASTLSFKRALVNTQTTFTGDIGTNPASVVADDTYIPITLAVTQSDIVAPGSTLTALATYIQGTAAAFDKVRVGDYIKTVTTGSITAPAVVARTGLFGVTGLNYLVYPATYNSSTLNIKSGDLIAEAAAGTTIPALAYVTKIDYATNRIFLSAALTATGVIDVDVTPRVRVTAVRTSTAVANANQIDISTSVATNGAASTVTIAGGAVDAVVTVLKITPIDGLTTGNSTLNVSAARLTGSLVVGTNSGMNNITDPSLLSYTALGGYTTNFDTFLLAAGVNAPVS
jgi:hypothetical protein